MFVKIRPPNRKLLWVGWRRGYELAAAEAAGRTGRSGSGGRGCCGSGAGQILGPGKWTEHGGRSGNLFDDDVMLLDYENVLCGILGVIVTFCGCNCAFSLHL